MKALHEILPGIGVWSIFAERQGYNFNGTLVSDGGLIVDPVEPSAEALAEIVAARPGTIVLTNRNHFRAAAKLAEATGARVLCHPDDAAFVASKGVAVDGALAHGQTVGPFTVVDASGKSPGEVALHWAGRKILLVGDACVGKVPGQLALLPEAVMDDPPRLKKSLARLADLDFDTVLCGDGTSILTGGQKALRDLVATLS